MPYTVSIRNTAQLGYIVSCHLDVSSLQKSVKADKHRRVGNQNEQLQ